MDSEKVKISTRVNDAEGLFDILLEHGNGKERLIAKCWDSTLCDYFKDTIEEYIKVEGMDPIDKDESDSLNLDHDDPWED